MPSDSMSCDRMRQELPLYLSSEMDAEGMAAFEGHAEACANCRQMVEGARWADAQLRRSVLDEPLETDAPMAGFRRAVAARPGMRMRWAMAVAAMLLVGLVLGGMAYRRMGGGDISTAALRDHHRELVDKSPRRWLDDAASVEMLAVEQGVNAPLLVSLAPAGYALEHGKLCRLNGKTYLHLVYASLSSDQHDEISLFLRGDGERRGEVFTAGLDGDHSAGVEAGGLSVVYVTDEAAKAMQLAAKASLVL